MCDVRRVHAMNLGIFIGSVAAAVICHHLLLYTFILDRGIPACRCRDFGRRGQLLFDCFDKSGTSASRFAC